MKVSENTSVSMPIKNMIGIILAVAMGIFAYTEITSRLTSLETSRELMLNDLLKASDQNSIDRAWGALFHYLIARPTKRKLWAMSEYQAISAVDKIKGSVERLSSILKSNIHKK